MDEVELVRVTLDKDAPQVGLILFNGYPELISYELPDHDNQPHISCIPTGKYRCTQVWRRQTSGGMLIPRTFEVQNVPNRSGILFHVGNTAKDTNGCILLGLRLGGQKPYLGISESAIAFKKFNELTVGWTEFILNITHAF